jgi:pyrimidine-nucleoside phosphorylase
LNEYLTMNIVEIITKKRDGRPLAREEIEWAVSQYSRGNLPDYQMSALLMAIYFQGMSRQEIRILTQAMINSGDTIDLSSIPGIKVDKHSTGGVGDKVSLVLAPLVAAAGVPVPMMSGRGLGHTGGTLDKLESIPGFRTQLTPEAFRRQIGDIGCAMIGQTEHIVPADGKMYSLRDVTGTVPSLPLICSSIISKKKAEGTDALVLDVKTGKGSFFKKKEESLRLARELVWLGNALSMRTVALLTAMDEPLGNAVGNWLETREAIAALQGKGPSDLMEITRTLGGVMLVIGNKADSIQKGKEQIQECIDSGEGFKRFLVMTEMQGGDLSVVVHPDKYLLPDCAVDVLSPMSGFVGGIDALKVGLLAMDLGAGRVQKEDAVDPGAGILLYKKTGDSVTRGDRLATLYTNKKIAQDILGARFLDALRFEESLPQKSPLIETLIDEKDEWSLPPEIAYSH